jgi:xylulose-5-phosphate/fructose-6-phosphate phosphoketolase
MAPASDEVGTESISCFGVARATVTEKPLSSEEIKKYDAYFSASLYLCLGMIYLKENPLLRQPLAKEHLKARILGHWGSDAGQAFTWLHFNRLIKKYDLDALFVSSLLLTT